MNELSEEESDNNGVNAQISRDKVLKIAKENKARLYEKWVLNQKERYALFFERNSISAEDQDKIIESLGKMSNLFTLGLPKDLIMRDAK